MAVEYHIYPPIGIARVGNSTDEFCIGPEQYLGLPSEVENGVEAPVKNFRDNSGRMKRQAARFYVYTFNPDKPESAGERIQIGQNNVIDIEWHVHLANKKAVWYEFEQLQGEQGYAVDHPLRNAGITSLEERQKLIIDPGPVTVSGTNNGVSMSRADGQPGYPVTFPPENLLPESINSLGEARTDAFGNLLVLGGLGNSGSNIEPKITRYANNDNWWDDISDGSVSATIHLADGSRIVASQPAWVLIAPPAYAPQVPNIITLYDVMYDLALKEFHLNTHIYDQGQWNHGYIVDYETEIRPLLERADLNQWVCHIPKDAHLFNLNSLGNKDSQYDAVRKRIASLFRQQGQENQKSNNNNQSMMPLLCGDNPISETLPSKYLVLTDAQLFFLSQWADGKFVTKDSTRTTTEEEELTHAVLSNCVGGPFCPGIEITWIARNPAIYASPFRIRHKTITQHQLSLKDDPHAGVEPGDLSKRMALPWQADFNECSTQDINDAEIYWWPAQRPMSVTVQTAPGLEASPPAEWSRGIPSHGSTPGDIHMVSEWKNLGFIRASSDPFDSTHYEVERDDDAFNPPKHS